jgi:hypothetical protein
MTDRYDIRNPSQGFHTLVSEASILQFDRLVGEIKDRRKSGVSERQILTEIDQRFRGFDELTRKKVYQLSLDLTPRDDVESGDVLERKDVNRTTRKLRVSDLDQRLQAGSIVYYERRRWVLTQLKGEWLTLKQF